MFRAIMIYFSKAKWARRLVTRWGFAWRAASRFVAGDTLQEALRIIERLNQAGCYATLDHLGEDVTNADEAIRATDDYIRLLEQLEKQQLKANVSVKLTQLGLNVDYDLCLSNMQCILRQAREMGVMVRIDIEDASTVDRTFALFRKLTKEGLSNVGLAIQSYLYRSEDDLRALLAEGAHFRLCKGAYKEPPDIAFPKKSDVDANYDVLTRILLDATLAKGAQPASEDGRVPPIPAIATHDESRIQFAKAYAEQISLPREALEFQMLLGIRSDLQTALVQEGYPVRVYVPYGTEWYPYYVRRLAERPANLWFFLSNLFRT
jgi:proline dehydrogenase